MDPDGSKRLRPSIWPRRMPQLQRILNCCACAPQSGNALRDGVIRRSVPLASIGTSTSQRARTYLSHNLVNRLRSRSSPPAASGVSRYHPPRAVNPRACFETGSMRECESIGVGKQESQRLAVPHAEPPLGQRETLVLGRAGELPKVVAIRRGGCASGKFLQRNPPIGPIPTAVHPVRCPRGFSCGQALPRPW